MRFRRTSTLQLIARLLMGALLLVGLSTNSHLAMAHSFSTQGAPVQATHHAVAAKVTAHDANGDIHACCEPTEAVQTCLVACAAVACATPVLPVLQTALASPGRTGVQPMATRFLRSQAPDIDTPPPKTRL